MYVRVNSPAVWLHASAGVWCISSVIVPARPREPVSSIIAIVIGTTSTPNQRAYSQYSSSALLLVPQAGRPTRGRPSEAMSRRARAPATMHGAGCATCRCARRMRRVTLPLHRPAPAATCQMLCYCSLAAVGRRRGGHDASHCPFWPCAGRARRRFAVSFAPPRVALAAARGAPHGDPCIARGRCMRIAHDRIVPRGWRSPAAMEASTSSAAHAPTACGTTRR